MQGPHCFRATETSRAYLRVKYFVLKTILSSRNTWLRFDDTSTILAFLMPIPIYAHTLTHTRTHTHTHAHTHTHTHTLTNVYIYIYIWNVFLLYNHTCLYIYIYIYKHVWLYNKNRFYQYNIIKIFSSFQVSVLVLGWNWTRNLQNCPECFRTFHRTSSGVVYMFK